MSFPENTLETEEDEDDLSFEQLLARLQAYCKKFRVGPPSAESLQKLISMAGIRLEDHRIALSRKELQKLLDHKDAGEELTAEQLCDVMRPNLRFLTKVLCAQLVIPEFGQFSMDLEALAELCEGDTSGETAQYIPPLRDVDPDQWGIAACTTDGQLFTHGDVHNYFSIQSTCKPITYAVALTECGEDSVHKWVGKEPSGAAFDALICLPDKRPHNMCVNAGAIMTAATLASHLSDKTVEQRVEHMMGIWSALCGDIGEVRFSKETMEAERETADDNFSLAYFIKSRRGLPPGVSLQTVTDFYFSVCSIEATCEMMAVVAGTLANGGICPLTNEEVFSADIVKKVLSVMQSCGMYDASGEFTYEIGLPAKSGVSGIIMSVVPNVCGFATFSPRLDKHGNSVRGLKFHQKLVASFAFHQFDNLSSMHSGCKRDPRFSQNSARSMHLRNLRFAVRNGDVTAAAFKRLLLEAAAVACKAHGKVEAVELKALKSVYKRLLHAEVESEELQEVCKRTSSEGLEGLEKRLQKHCSDLEDIQREILLEAVFEVATADGNMADEELHVLQRVAAALRVPPAVTELKLFEWKRRRSLSKHVEEENLGQNTGKASFNREAKDMHKGVSAAVSRLHPDSERLQQLDGK